MDINLKEVTRVVTAVQRRAGEIHLHPERYGIVREVISKEQGKDFTSSVDLAVEDLQKNELRKKFSEVGFLGEERDSEESERFCFIIDPTDGTAVYECGGEYYSNSIALADKKRKKVVFGSVYQPSSEKQFLRTEDGIWVAETILSRDGKPKLIERKPRPSTTKGLPELMGCAFGTSKHYDLIPGIKEKLERVFDKVNFPSLRREYSMINARPASGSSALFCCDIADGKRHFALLFFQKAWDLAVGALYARDAGCIVECGHSIETFTGGNLEEQIASCSKNSLINVGVFANEYVKETVLGRLE